MQDETLAHVSGDENASTLRLHVRWVQHLRSMAGWAKTCHSHIFDMIVHDVAVGMADNIGGLSPLTDAEARRGVVQGLLWQLRHPSRPARSEDTFMIPWVIIASLHATQAA